MRLLLSEASVHLSRQFLEKLTDSAIIKIALWEDLSGEVATGSRRLAASPRGGTESSNPSPSSSQSVSAVNPEAMGEKPRTLAAVCGWLGM